MGCRAPLHFHSSPTLMQLEIVQRSRLLLSGRVDFGGERRTHQHALQLINEAPLGEEIHLSVHLISPTVASNLPRPFFHNVDIHKASNAREALKVPPAAACQARTVPNFLARGLPLSHLSHCAP